MSIKSDFSDTERIIVNFDYFIVSTTRLEHFITCLAVGRFSSDFKRIMSIRKRRYFQWIKLTQNALSISPHKLIFGSDHIHYWTFFSLRSFSRGRNDLMIIIFVCFDQHHIWICKFHLRCLFFLSLTHSPHVGELNKNLLMIIIIWIWWWIFNDFDQLEEIYSKFFSYRYSNRFGIDKSKPPSKTLSAESSVKSDGFWSRWRKAETVEN